MIVKGGKKHFVISLSFTHFPNAWGWIFLFHIICCVSLCFLWLFIHLLFCDCHCENLCKVIHWEILFRFNSIRGCSVFFLITEFCLVVCLFYVLNKDFFFSSVRRLRAENVWKLLWKNERIHLILFNSSILLSDKQIIWTWNVNVFSLVIISLATKSSTLDLTYESIRRIKSSDLE